MRIRTAIALVSLYVLPAALSAQRIPLPIGRQPARPEPLPPQPAPIANELAYRRWRLSVESYPMVSYFTAPGLTGSVATSSWMTLGTGTRAEYLLTRNLSATLDLTSSMIGGPLLVSTAELGARMHPEWAERRIFPYFDARFGYISAFEKGLGQFDQEFAYQTGYAAYGSRYSDGFGAIGGVGVEYPFNIRWSITTAGYVVGSRMTPHDFQYANSGHSYSMTSFRYTIALRYTPVRYIPYPGSDTR
jgi:hypothetical protein